MKMRDFLYFIVFVVIIIGSVLWVEKCYYANIEYEEYCKTIIDQNLDSPLPFYVWEPGRTLGIIGVTLFLVWIPLLDYAIRIKAYPFLKTRVTYREIKRASRSTSRSLYEGLYGAVLGYFSRVNRKVGAKIGFWFMKIETFEHTHLLTKVFKLIILPLCILYFFVEIYFFGNVVFDTLIIGVLLFLYSNFVPDLPAIFRRRIFRDERDLLHEHLAVHKTYSLLLFAPVFIVLLFCGITIKWKTTETFHNFKSLAIYSSFIITVSLLVLIVFPITIGGMVETFFVSTCAILGYLTHLRVDMLF